MKLEESYWVKLHVGSKDTRYICDSREELCDIINAWAKVRNVEIKINKEEIGDIYDF